MVQAAGNKFKKTERPVRPLGGVRLHKGTKFMHLGQISLLPKVG
jgi:hypothetical protein